MSVDCYPHAVPGLYLVGGSTSSAGATLAWAAQHLCPTGAAQEPLRLGDVLEPAEAAEVVFLPYLAGERCPLWDPHARGLLVGMTLDTTREQIARAVFCGVAFSLRHVLDTLGDLGVPVEDLVASGDTGVEAGSAWPVLRSTVYGRPLLLPPAQGDPTALGTLLLTLVAIGAQPDVATAAARLVPRPEQRVEPLAVARDDLERRYRLYRAVGRQMAPLSTLWAGE
jgi:xylulokinase